MQEKSQEERLEEIIDRLIGQRNYLASSAYFEGRRLDTSKPNIHDSKKDFLKERDAVAAIAEHFRAALAVLLVQDEDAAHLEMIGRLRTAIDVGSMKKNEINESASSRALALHNVAQTGFFHNSLAIVMRAISLYSERLRELNDQEREFWSLSNRAPNYFARTIALRLARLYAKQKQVRPTFGIARDGNHPSTEFGRALEEVYAVLGIRASVRNAASWAIDQLTEDDISPPVNALGSLYNYMDTTPTAKQPESDYDELIEAMGGRLEE